MPKSYLLYLKDINDSIKSIEKFIKNMSFEQFKSDDKTSSAVIRKLEIIGEATKKIPKNVKEKYPQIPWKDIAGMRDKLIHAYSDVDLKLVWKTIQIRVPELKSFLEKMLE
ncbi:MAG: DUF86 domain-containing protein [Promethearchaeota archaeon]|nr:MAG: DUF86 domain-containing protein [Candidatus Lokiarchaeota archaeon]